MFNAVDFASDTVPLGLFLFRTIVVAKRQFFV